jgi:hypothetical protein
VPQCALKKITARLGRRAHQLRRLAETQGAILEGGKKDRVAADGELTRKPARRDPDAMGGLPQPFGAAYLEQLVQGRNLFSMRQPNPVEVLDERQREPLGLRNLSFERPDHGQTGTLVGEPAALAEDQGVLVGLILTALNDDGL